MDYSEATSPAKPNQVYSLYLKIILKKEKKLKSIDHENQYIFGPNMKEPLRFGLWDLYIFPEINLNSLFDKNIDHEEISYSNCKLFYLNGILEGEILLIDDLIENLPIPEGKTLHKGNMWNQLNFFIK